MDPMGNGPVSRAVFVTLCCCLPRLAFGTRSTNFRQIFAVWGSNLCLDALARLGGAVARVVDLMPCNFYS